MTDHNHHTQAFHPNCVPTPVFVACSVSLAVGLVADGAMTSAKRRRERRLRSMLRHERQTVAMELAAALHHSRDGGRETNYGLRAPKTASLGWRPGVLTEPEPQGQERPWTFPRRSQVPPEPQPLLHLGVGEVHDGTLVSFLLQRALQERREEEERRMLEEQEKLNFLRAVAQVAKRKRKKRRKRRTPPPLALFVVALDVDNGSGMLVLLVLLVMFLFALCSLRLTTGPRCLASWLVRIRRTVFHDYGALTVDSGQWHVQGWFYRLCSSLCIPSSCRQAKMLGILAGMDQRDKYSALVVVTAVVCAWLVFLVPLLSRCILFDFRQARDAGHHGAPGQGCSLPVCASSCSS